MAVVSMILNHNNDEQGFGAFQALVLKCKILNILYKFLTDYAKNGKI